jgi:hypothetical protein
MPTATSTLDQYSMESGTDKVRENEGIGISMSDVALIIVIFIVGIVLITTTATILIMINRRTSVASCHR